MVEFLWLTGRSMARRAVGDGVACRRVRVGLALLLCVRVCVSPRLGRPPPLCGGPLGGRGVYVAVLVLGGRRCAGSPAGWLWGGFALALVLGGRRWAFGAV
jgi:hypothetical protein